MKRNKHIFLMFIMCILITVSNPGSLFCFDDILTHPEVTQTAISNSNLKNYLLNNLGFSQKEKTFLKNSSTNQNFTVQEWLQKGSTDEDAPICRATGHFHNPLLLWNQSYMTDAPWWVNTWCSTWPRYSAITWATGQQYPDGQVFNRNNQDMGWDNARRYFHTALISATPAERDTNFAKTFQSLGQVMHLLQDMAVPAHVRNDFEAHLTFTGIRRDNVFSPGRWFGNPFEFYVKEHSDLISGLTTTIISLNTPTFPRTTDFWDTTQYRLNTDPNAILTGVGLAEYTSGTFFSDSTIPNNKPTPEHDFPNPKINVDSLHQYVCMDNVPGKAEPVKYVSRKPCLAARKAQDHFAALSLINSEEEASFTNPRIKEVWLDDNVHNAYSQDLLPRAVGYSAGLLNYFFRGQLGAGLVSRMVTTGQVEYGLKVKNQSTETMTTYNDPVTGRVIGSIEIYYDAVVSSGTSTTTERRLLKSCPLSTTDCWQTPPNQLLPNQETDPIFFPIPTDNANRNQYTIVFRGMLGNEQGAVMVGRVNYWSEEWDGALKSNHYWWLWEERLHYNPWMNVFDKYENERRSQHEVVNGKLILENTSKAYSANTLGVSKKYNLCDHPSMIGRDCTPHYCDAKIFDDSFVCATYDTGTDFPIPVTQNTVIRIKVDKISITPPLPQEDYREPTDTTSCFPDPRDLLPLWPHYQGIRINFSNYEDLFFTVIGHDEPNGNVLYLEPGQEFATNIYETFRISGIPFSEPLSIIGIGVDQSLTTLCPDEHTQTMVVDYIRIEEAPQ